MRVTCAIIRIWLRRQRLGRLMLGSIESSYHALPLSFSRIDATARSTMNCNIASVTIQGVGSVVVSAII